MWAENIEASIESTEIAQLSKSYCKLLINIWNMFVTFWGGKTADGSL